MQKELKLVEEFHRSSQMSKNYHQYKMVKGENYQEVDIKKILKD